MVVVLDPALHSAGGHHHSAYLRLRQELAARGVRCRYLVSSRADTTLRLDVDVRPVFSRCVYGRSTWSHSQFADDVETTLSELKRGLGWGAQYADVVVVPCADQVLTLALARYLGSVDRSFAPQLLIWLLYGPHWKRGLQDRETGRLAYECQVALSALAKVVHRPADLTLVCETDAMASYYSAITGIRVGVKPGPGLRFDMTIGSTGSHGNLPTILSIGHANAAKGYRLLAPAIRRVFREGLQARFLIHGNMHDCDDARAVATMTELEQLTCEMSTVSVNTGILAVGDYQRWMTRADVVLMPYDPAVYGASRGSGVLFDAEKLGIPAIAPRQCGFAANGIAEGRIAPIERYDSDGVADAIVDAVARIASLKERALAHATRKTDDLGQMLDFHLGRATTRRPQQRKIMQRAIALLGRS